MLGLRPRLRPRPSLLDLVRTASPDQPLPRPATPSEGGIRPQLVPLPKSPELVPQEIDDVDTPPPYSPVDETKQDTDTDKMPPVSRMLEDACEGLVDAQ